MFFLSKRIAVISLFLLSVFVVVFAQTTSKDLLVEDVPSAGARNAIMRAYQMTDIEFTTLSRIHANPDRTYKAGEKTKGLIYSSVKETYGFVGLDVSFHTFMTAIHNPKSVIYNVDVSKPPYHGVNCGAYYGTVCSGLTSYAFGLRVYQKTYDFATSDDFMLVEDQSSIGVRLADVVNSGGHVQIVTRIKRNLRDGKAVEIEICEGVRQGCHRDTISGKDLDKVLTQEKRRRKLYRYKHLDSVKYTPLTGFVAVEGEKLTPFKYNDAICTNRGDRACFIVGDTVTLNIRNGFKKVNIYKDGKPYMNVKLDKNLDAILSGLPHGDYSARAINKTRVSEPTFWKVIETRVEVDRKNNMVSFHSDNATPVYLEFCSISGGRPTKGIFKFTTDDIAKGYIDVSSYTTKLSPKSNDCLVKVHFECNYGMVINKPVNWFK